MSMRRDEGLYRFGNFTVMSRRGRCWGLVGGANSGFRGCGGF